ncbi:hypothetical protein GY45DRAFT_789032 [Cubamyces sp. BRFM 1775]|nr:hypothetical protein GY45DRAFT_789032 [Cubamyces sp. BRFM 1775]
MGVRASGAGCEGGTMHTELGAARGWVGVEGRIGRTMRSMRYKDRPAGSADDDTRDCLQRRRGFREWRARARGGYICKGVQSGRGSATHVLISADSLRLRGRALATSRGNRDGVGGLGLAGTREQRDRIRSEPAQTAPGPMIRYVVADASGVRNNWRSDLCHWALLAEQRATLGHDGLAATCSHSQPPL